MKFRFARHTSDLTKIKTFYTEIVGLNFLGSFENHADYDGIFLGIPGENWHLEFTSSSDLPTHQFDEDDALVFYLSDRELQEKKFLLSDKNIPIETSKNPYWITNGIQITDPDGFKVIFSLEK